MSSAAMPCTGYGLGAPLARTQRSGNRLGRTRRHRRRSSTQISSARCCGAVLVATILLAAASLPPLLTYPASQSNASYWTAPFRALRSRASSSSQVPSPPELYPRQLVLPCISSSHSPQLSDSVPYPSPDIPRKQEHCGLLDANSPSRAVSSSSSQPPSPAGPHPRRQILQRSHFSHHTLSCGSVPFPLTDIPRKPEYCELMDGRSLSRAEWTRPLPPSVLPPSPSPSLRLSSLPLLADTRVYGSPVAADTRTLLVAY